MSATPTIEVATIVFDGPSEIISNVEQPKRRYQWFRTYFSKWTGQHLTTSPAPVTLSDCIATLVGTLLGVSILGVIHYRLLAKYVCNWFYIQLTIQDINYCRHDLAFFMASFGATAVLVYGLPLSPLSQPRNVIGGQVISAIVGCIVRLIFGTHGEPFVAVALSVSVTAFVMQVTNTVHAPAGATAVIAITTSTPFAWAGFQFVLMPVLSGSLILTFLAVVVNNLASNRHYPCRWWWDEVKKRKWNVQRECPWWVLSCESKKLSMKNACKKSFPFL
jgi:CBS-domain-containing membrane protein